MNLLYFDCQSGISGDMAVGALLDMGMEIRALARELFQLKLPPVYDIESEKLLKNGVASTAFRVIVPQSDEVCGFFEMQKWMTESALSAKVKREALAALGLLERARRRRYGAEGAALALSEAVSCVVKLVSAMICIGWTGAEMVLCSPMTEGRGFAETKGGLVRLPSPVVTELMREAGAPLEICSERTQLITETGAALICAAAQRFCELPSMTVSAVGFGAGAKDLVSRANVLRVLLGRNEYCFAQELCTIEQVYGRWMP